MTLPKRVLIKLSGGALANASGFGFDQNRLSQIVEEVLQVVEMGVEVGIVVGGGNIMRGSLSAQWGLVRAEADSIGMLGTLVNALMLRAALKSRTERDVRVLSAIKVESVAENFRRGRALKHLQKGHIVIYGAGIGQPYVTTDYPSVQRAIETDCDLLLVAKEGVDGVFDSDPKSNPDANMYRTLAYDDFLEKDLRVMDQAAILMARDHEMPIHIFNFLEKGAMQRICQGE
ncbi:MAG: UMP kinase, partial [Bacteroidota bacterium]